MSKWSTLLTRRQTQRNRGQVRLPLSVHPDQSAHLSSSPPPSTSTSIDLVESSSLIEQITIVVDGQSKDSPGPQIIDVQTIYLNSGSRKRRMDWDSLDIGQSENSPTASQSGDLPSKVAHQEKEKHKREKHSGKDYNSIVFNQVLCCRSRIGWN